MIGNKIINNYISYALYIIVINNYEILTKFKQLSLLCFL